MELKIYTDETFTVVREVRTAERMRIPYRVGQYVVNVISSLDLNDDQEVLHKVLDSEEQITAVVRATFGLTDEDLDHVDIMELTDLAKEIIAFVVNKMAELGVGKEDTDPNGQTPATATP